MKVTPGTLREGGASFATTHWSVVAQSAFTNVPEAANALAQLCELYWPPIYSFIRRRGYAPSLAEVLKNGTVIGSGQVNSVPGGSSGFNNAILDIINMTLPNAVAFNPGDTLSFRLSVRVAATGHRSGTARLWFNDVAANSRLNAVISGSTNSYFLRNGFTLESTAGPGPRNTIDIFVDRAAGGNPFKPFGTWNKSF